MQLIISAATKYTKREGNEMSRNWPSQGSKKLYLARISPELKRFIRTLAIFEIHRSELSPGKQSRCMATRTKRSFVTIILTLAAEGG